MSNSMIFGDYFENRLNRSLRRHVLACQHWFFGFSIPVTPNQGVKPFSYACTH